MSLPVAFFTMQLLHAVFQKVTVCVKVPKDILGDPGDETDQIS
jgi:hypothetical protein